MRLLVMFLLISSLASTFGIGLVLSKCVQVCTGNHFDGLVFQAGFGFLSSLFVSNYVMQNYFKILWDIK